MTAFVNEVPPKLRWTGVAGAMGDRDLKDAQGHRFNK